MSHVLVHVPGVRANCATYWTRFRSRISCVRLLLRESTYSSMTSSITASGSRSRDPPQKRFGRARGQAQDNLVGVGGEAAAYLVLARAVRFGTLAYRPWAEWA